MAHPQVHSNKNSKKIWIDLDNSPHVLFFNPVIQALKDRGYGVVVTARDYSQVIGLAELFHLDYMKIGRHYGKNKFLKVIGLLIRSLQMVPILVQEKPDLAFSHGSRSQIFIAKIMGLPTIHAFDYEHATKVPFVRPSYAIVPELIPEEDTKKKAKKILRYPGIKEDVYVDRLIPDPGILETLGIHEKEIVVTIRPPATVAHYHNPKSDDLFQTVTKYLCDKPNTRIIIMPRTTKQGLELKETWAEYFSKGKIVIPEQVVDGLNLIWYSDMVISAGGTMIREAAALGVPAYSIFGGEIGAVDRYLAEAGRLAIIHNVEDVQEIIVIGKRERPEKPGQSKHAALSVIIDKVIEALKNSR